MTKKAVTYVVSDINLNETDMAPSSGSESMMEVSEEKRTNIYQRLHAIMEAVKYVQKEEKMVNGQYRFVSHDAVSALIRPELVKQRVLLLTSVKSHRQEGNRTEVELELTFINIDFPSDNITLLAFGYGIDGQDKGPGKAISYAFKYALLKMFCLETGDDPEQDNIDFKKPKVKVEEGSKEHLIIEFQALLAKREDKEELWQLLRTKFSAETIEQFSEAALKWCINKMQEKE